MTHADGRTVAQIVAAEWCRVLETASAAPGDEFFELGGDSRLAVDFMAGVEGRLGVEFPIEALFLDGEFGAVVAACADVAADSPGAVPAPGPGQPG